MVHSEHKQSTNLATQAVFTINHCQMEEIGNDSVLISWKTGIPMFSTVIVGGLGLQEDIMS